MLRLIRSLYAEAGVSVVLSTHILRDVETVCDSVVILGSGKLLVHDSVAALRKPVAESLVVSLDAPSSGYAEALHAEGARFEDRRAGELRLSNSGLPYPLHYSSDTRRCQPIEVAGVPLGALDGSTYEDRELKLRPGDVFVFYSDGVSEASRHGEDYGTERLRRVIEREAAAGVGAIGDAIAEDLHAFLGDEEPSDDVTIVVVKVRT